jgi:hypothetical protein
MAFAVDPNFDWQVKYNNVADSLSGTQCRYAAAP